MSTPFDITQLAAPLHPYGVDNIDHYRSAASYVDRILKGEKPADLPVQLATKYELVINNKTAKAASLKCPIFPLHRGRRPYMAHRDISRRRSNSVVFGAKQTFCEPRLQNRFYEYTR